MLAAHGNQNDHDDTYEIAMKNCHDRKKKWMCIFLARWSLIVTS